MQRKLKMSEQYHSAVKKQNCGTQKPGCKTWVVILLLLWVLVRVQEQYYAEIVALPFKKKKKQACVTWRKFNSKQENGWGSKQHDVWRETATTGEGWMEIQVFKYVKGSCKETEVVFSSSL